MEQFRFFGCHRGHLQDDIRLIYLVGSINNTGAGFAVFMIREMGIESCSGPDQYLVAIAYQKPYPVGDQ